MTDRDPVDAWLGADVEPMSPPPGTFERVHRRARRRKAVRAVSAAGGAAVIVAAAATLPQVAHGLLSGRSGGPAQVGTRSQSAASGGSTAATPTSSRRPANSLPLSTAGNGPPPAGGFHPVSVTFVGAGNGAVIGAALGMAGSCGTRPCMVMAGTRNYGTKWSAISAPRAGPADASSGVSQIRFLDQADGWVYGPALFETHDGGRHWHKITYLRGRVIDLSTVRSRAFAVIGINCAGTGSDFTANCARFSLYSAPGQGGRWRPVPGASGSEPVVPGALQLTARDGYLIAGGRLFAGPVTTRAWHAVKTASATPSCLTSNAGHAVWLIAPDQSALYLACGTITAANRLDLYVSVDGGRTWGSRGTIPVPASSAKSLTVSPGGRLVLATTAGIYRSNGARTWQRASLTARSGASLTAPAGGFGFVGMTTDSNGVAVPASPGRAVFVTTDGGRIWRQMPISP